MPTATVNEGTPPPLNVRSYVWNATTQKWDETITPVARAEADWPALIVLPDGNVYNADTAGIFLTDEQKQQLDPDAVGAAPKLVTVT